MYMWAPHCLRECKAEGRRAELAGWKWFWSVLGVPEFEAGEDPWKVLGGVYWISQRPPGKAGGEWAPMWDEGLVADGGGLRSPRRHGAHFQLRPGVAPGQHRVLALWAAGPVGPESPGTGSRGLGWVQPHRRGLIWAGSTVDLGLGAHLCPCPSWK